MKTYPWMRDLWKGGEILTREQFVATYYPKYSRPYQSPTGIHTYRNKAGRMVVARSTPASYQAQVTKRANIIDESYSQYVALMTEANRHLIPHPSHPMNPISPSTKGPS